MKEKKKPSLSSIHAAERVRKLFPTGNQTFCHTFKRQLDAHHYDPVIIPKIPSGSKSLAFYGKRLKTASKKQRSWNSKQKGGERALAFKENFSKHSSLNPARVKLCKLKEHYLVSRKLKLLSLQKQVIDHLKNKFTILNQTLSQDFVKDERMEYWETLLQNKEERHFNIGRIIKYLSD